MDKATVIALLRGGTCESCYWVTNKPYDGAIKHCILKIKRKSTYVDDSELTQESLISNPYNHSCAKFHKRI